MRKFWSVVGSVIFFFVAPGTVAFLVPWLISRQTAGLVDFGVLRWAGLVMGLLGLGALVECFARFALQGLGTPAPIAPTQHLVVKGLYRFVRNPMYVAVLAVILGQALWSGSWALVVYGAAVWAGFVMFVALYEEPTLRKDFGEQYEVYCANVRAWIPRLTPWTEV